MQCQSCHKNEATIHLTEINDGVRSELHLCESCAQQQGIAIKSQIPLNELLSSLLASQPEEEEIGASGKQRCCPECGFTMEQFRKEGLLGCPYDYEIFEEPLLALIGKAQNGNTYHTGKIPSKMPADTRNKIELSALRQELERAVKREDYELAAQLRDKIDRLR